MRDEQVVIFQMGVEQYAVPMSAVREIIVPPQIRSVPNAKGHVRGIISLRTKVITVLNLAQLLKLDSISSVTELQRRIVVLEDKEVLLGIEVDEVKEVLDIARYELEPPPAAVGRETFLDGILNLGERLILMLNVPALFAS
ncbi:chemotaxis protein CheW [Paradesulfitobacterium ferrireducens]|uniref:chemotaxis protein CheW n=1 Tax=Paradesulfitobacterium ferrireducens TaxID=2816476 RepID=UPI001A8D1A91|nr:chemotaxis protein CheW [Paradesulfitobacterium ferrireducens]